MIMGRDGNSHLKTFHVKYFQFYSISERSNEVATQCLFTNKTWKKEHKSSKYIFSICITFTNNPDTDKKIERSKDKKIEGEKDKRRER